MNWVEQTAAQQIPGRHGNVVPLSVTAPSFPIGCLNAVELARVAYAQLYQQIRRGRIADIGEFAGRHAHVGAHDTPALTDMSALDLTRTRAGLV